MRSSNSSERALLIAPRGRDAAVAERILQEAGIEALACRGILHLTTELDKGSGFVLATEEALADADASPLADWLSKQEEWSDMPFILLTQRGGGLERNPSAKRYLNLLGNVIFLERPFHPTTLVSLAQSALRGRRRQYDARTRLQELQRLAGSLEDRVEKATAERELAFAQLHEAQKLETLGQLTGGVAHDFNNLLTPITMVLDRLLRRGGEIDERNYRLIESALESAGRAKTLVQRLLGFARRQALQTRPVDLADLLEGMRDLIASSLGPTIELRMEWAPALPCALADPNQLELALLNLCVNARDAMPAGGVLRIEVSLDDGASRDRLGAQSGRFLVLAVEDDGAGMDEDTLRHAVEPFYSTKEIGKGTGLGLSMVHGLASQLGGGFHLTSTPGKGTRAELLLPVAEEGEATTRQPRIEQVEHTIPPLSILLVDDEHLVRNATAEMLRDLGHSVHEESNAQAALGRLGGMPIDAVITDYKMPQMDGAEFAARIREQRPDMPVLLITGYAGTEEPPYPLPRVDKPFRRSDLARALEQLFENEAQPG